MDRRLHTAADGTQNCDRVAFGKHVFAWRHWSGLRELRCQCGKRPIQTQVKYVTDALKETVHELERHAAEDGGIDDLYPGGGEQGSLPL